MGGVAEPGLKLIITKGDPGKNVVIHELLGAHASSNLAATQINEGEEMSGTLKTKIKLPCECGHNRFKTKGDVDYRIITKYQCRKCGFVREISRMQVINEV